MKKESKELIRMVGGISPMILTHGACLILGAYKGSMNSHGMEFDVPFRYLYGANILATSVGNHLIKKGTVLEKIVKGAVTGAVTTPVEFISTYWIGYICGRISNKVFF